MFLILALLSRNTVYV